MKKLALIALILVVVAAPAFAERVRAQNTFASDMQTVPVMANVTGQGGRFTSYVALFNPTSSPMTVDVTLYDHAGQTREATIALAANELKTYTNFLETVFNYTGGGAATFRSANASQRFILSTEVRSGATGMYSTPVPSLEFAGSASRAFSAGITADSSSRTNIGCFNQSGNANVVRATVYDKSGQMAIATLNLNLPANAWGQMNVNAVVADGFVRFEPAEPAVCYAVVVNNATNDGRFIAATEYQP